MTCLTEKSLILLAEDREDDILLIRKAFERANFGGSFFVVRDGEQAIAYLKGEAPFQNRQEYPLPELLLLDLKMPRKDGFEVLSWIREEPTLVGLRVIVLTSSGAASDIDRAYELGAASFLVKPDDLKTFIDLSKLISGFWFRVNHQIRSGESA